MKKLICLSIFLLLLLSAFLPVNESDSFIRYSDDDQFDSFRLVSKYVDENERCFKCHDRSVVMPEPGKTVNQDSINLKENQIITRQEFYRSNHRSLSCVGCHADPLPGSPDRTSKEAAVSRTCNDCHQYLKDHTHFKFAAIEEEYLQSIHHKRKQAEFSCWKCHNPHINRITSRNTENMYAVIADDNRACLSCHKHAVSFSDHDKKEVTEKQEKHNWLPETEEHLKGVRCIDCHTKINKDLIIAHQILPKEESVRKCSECHSQNSILLITLYKNQYNGDIAKNAMLNSVIMNNVYVAGANRSNTVNNICLSLLGLVFCGILMHMIPRILTKPKN
jgi:hypothetical protein